MVPPTQVRLTEQDKARIREIQEWHGLSTLASVLRYAVNIVHRAGPPLGHATPKAPRRKEKR